MTKGDAILRLLTEIKLELKDTREAVERLGERVNHLEKQIHSIKPRGKDRKETDWKYPSKLK